MCLRMSAITYLCALLFLITSCSSSDLPVIPDNAKDSPGTVPAIELAASDKVFNSMGMLGAFELTINPDDLTVELTSKRFSTIGEDFIVSGIEFFTIEPCIDCLKIAGVSFADGNTSVEFQIDHPFDPGNTSGPPTAVNRLDLDVFDLAMLIKPDNTPAIFPLMGMNAYADALADPDGYTRELVNMCGTGNALPYVLIVDESDEASHTWNEFPMGGTEFFDVTFQYTGGTSFRFEMYLTMGYGASAKKINRLTPKYYNPEFNRKAAWKVEANALGTWNDEDDSISVDVEVAVYDWQAGATVYGNPSDFENAPIDNIYASSEIGSVEVEIPGMISTMPISTVPDSGTGMPLDPYIFTFPISNELLASAGTYTGLVKVFDERQCMAPMYGRDYLIYTEDGLVLNEIDMLEYSTYQTFSATVEKCAEVFAESVLINVGMSGVVRDVFVSGDYAYVADNINFLVINITNPLQAWIEKTVPLTPSWRATAVYVDGGFAYVLVAQPEPKLCIIDVDPLVDAAIVNSIGILSATNDIEVSEGYAYVAATTLHIIDVDPPEAVSVVKTVSAEWPWGLDYQDGYVYIAGGHQYLYVVDVDPINSASIVNQDVSVIQAHDVSVNDNYAYVADSNELKIIDINPPESANLVNSFPLPLETVDVHIQGCYAYTLDCDNIGAIPPHIQVLEVAPPGSAYLVTSVALPNYSADNSALELFVVDNMAYVANYLEGLTIVQLW